MKEITEADPMKEVLHLRATFAPTQQIVKFGPRRETMKEIIEADADPMNELLRLRATFLPHPLNKLCCKIWAKASDLSKL